MSCKKDVEKAPIRSGSVPTQYCSALNCHNARAKNRKMSFFRFPKDKDRCMKWVDNCRRNELQQKDPESLYRNYAFCADHFEDSQFMNVQAKNRLVWNAIPTVFDVPDPPPTIAEEKASGSPFFPPSPPKEDSDDDHGMMLGVVRSVPDCISPTTETIQPNPDDYSAEVAARIVDGDCEPTEPVAAKSRKRLSAVVLTPQQIRRIKTRQLVNRQRIKIWRLKKQVAALKSKVKTIDTPDDIVRYASKYLSKVSLDFFANQIRMASKKNRGKRWTRDDQYFALLLHCISADAYRLCNKVFNLPNVRTLQRWLKGFKQEPDFEKQLRAYKENLLRNTDRDSVAEAHSATSDQPVRQALTAEGPPEDGSNSQGPGRHCPLQSLSRQLGLKPKRARTAGQRGRQPEEGTGQRQPEPPLELFASFTPFEQPAPHHIQFQLHSNPLDPQTFQFLADGDLDATSIAAVRELDPQGTVTLTPITNGLPVTLAGDILNLEIVTLNLEEEDATAVQSVGLT